MREIVLYIAMSLDGYIGDERGKVDWLQGQSEIENYDSYSQFIERVDTVIMGWNTYHQVVRDLSPEKWVYEGLMSYVVTNRECSSTDAIQFTKENPCTLVSRLKKEEGKAIWICGGASIAKQLMQENLIDTYHIAIIPTILGKGITLFGEVEHELKLELKETLSYNGIVEVIYQRRVMRE